MSAVNPPKNADKKICILCDFKCSKQSDWNRHILTRKHLNRINLNNLEQTLHSEFTCKICHKIYKARNSLWYHEQKCKQNESPPVIEKTESEIKMLTDLVLEVVKSNAELQKQMMDLYKNGNTTTNNNNNINHSYNKTFNLQFFLNEQCKDAMNIMDFVNSMTLEFTDLEDVGKLGYVEGISNIIIRKLNEMDIYKRPIHCSDGKREIMFVKDDNVWEKENSTYDRLRKAIKHVSYKNSSMLVPWSQKYPACMNNQHHLNDTYVEIMSQSMGGKESFVESENKIMKKIAKAVLINKV
jgi:hypothetical protein